LLVALAADAPLWLGAAVIGLFAVFHGHAHGAEVPESASGIAYMAGFSLATVLLHVIGVGFALGMVRLHWRAAVRVGGAACCLVGIGLAMNWL
jgi:urease accessory protein